MAKSNEELLAKITEQAQLTRQPTLKEYGLSWFKKNGNALRQLMGTEKEAKRLFLTGMYVASQNEKLLKCEPQSFFTALLRCAELKLYPGPLQEAAIVPFYNSKKGFEEAVFMPQYQGLIKLAMNSGMVRSIYAEVVREADEFTFQLGSMRDLRHVPALKNRGEMIAVYAHANLLNGADSFIVLSAEDVHAIRARSRGFQNDSKYNAKTSPWSQKDAEPWMWRKSAIKQLIKMLPKSPELAAAVEADDAAASNEAAEKQIPIVDLVAGLQEEINTESAEKPEPTSQN